ncbi:hypothetical protein [Kitasatospora sp. NPDC088351]|uniref:hypothetical protein n=1 Tax=unclassified Kitasatospora TaxID=2633591 RepID=UPI003443CD47
MTETTADAGLAPGVRPSPSWAPWIEQTALRCTGAALAVAACGVDGAPGGVLDRGGPAAVAAAAVLAVWAAAPPAGPARPATTWPARFAGQRTTVLAVGSVLLACSGEPSLWPAVAVTVLLTGYLLLVDAFGPDRRGPRPAHALTAVAASALVLPAAFVPTTAGEWSRPFALLGLLAAAIGTGLALRPRTAGTPPPE